MHNLSETGPWCVIAGALLLGAAWLATKGNKRLNEWLTVAIIMAGPFLLLGVVVLAIFSSQ